MLPPERHTNDGEAKQHPEKEVRSSNPDSATKNPDNIGKCLQTAATCIAVDHFSSEWPQHKFGKFKTLQSEGNADDGTT